MANDYFDVMTSIVNKKKISEDLILQHFNGWGTVKWLSGHPKALYEANMINSARGNKFIGKIQEYKALRGLIQIPKNTYLKMDKADKHMNTIINLIKNHFQVGTFTAKDYYNILPGSEIIKLLERYGRKNENMMSAKELKSVKDIRDALVNKKKILESKNA